MKKNMCNPLKKVVVKASRRHLQRVGTVDSLFGIAINFSDFRSHRERYAYRLDLTDLTEVFPLLPCYPLLPGPSPLPLPSPSSRNRIEHSPAFS